jgi:outer membrane receptor protein involved in Fe transport
MKGRQEASAELRFANLPQEEKDKLTLIFYQIPLTSLFWDDLRISVPVMYSPNAINSLFTTSGYGLVEYNPPDRRFSAELGLRIDHYYLSGSGFSHSTKPALNPRLNLDYNVFKNKWPLESLDIGAGTGLFSTTDNAIFMAEKRHEVSEIKPNRSWTSVFGSRLEFPEGLSFNIEGYFKYVFNRMYIPISFSLEDIDIRPKFDGEGRVWGIDMMLQKLQSRFWDGWLAYSFSWARYRDPSGGDTDIGISGGTRGDDWYFPGVCTLWKGDFLWQNRFHSGFFRWHYFQIWKISCPLTG